MKKFLLSFGLLLIFASCQKKEDNFSKKMIEKLSVVDSQLPSVYSSMNLYVLTNGDRILQTTNDYLFRHYKQNYSHKFKTFDLFLNQVLNNGFVINQKLTNKLINLDSFTLNPKVEKEYNKLGFATFLKKYSKKSARKDIDLELNKSSIKDGEYQSVVYLFYKNKFDVSSDCYIGKDYIRKRKDRFK